MATCTIDPTSTPTPASSSRSDNGPSPLRQPVRPLRGGLLSPSFTYRNAEKTDVRLTWEQAKTAAQDTAPQN